MPFNYTNWHPMRFKNDEFKCVVFRKSWWSAPCSWFPKTSPLCQIFVSDPGQGKYIRMQVYQECPLLEKGQAIWVGDKYFEQFFMRISKM